MNENLQQVYQAISDVLTRTKDVNDQMMLHLALHLVQTEMAAEAAEAAEAESTSESFEQMVGVRI